MQPTAMPAHLTVKERRALRDKDDDEAWFCDACGCQDEDGMCEFEVERVTRQCPSGVRGVMLCYDCASRVAVTRVVNS